MVKRIQMGVFLLMVTVMVTACSFNSGTVDEIDIDATVTEFYTAEQKKVEAEFSSLAGEAARIGVTLTLIEDVRKNVETSVAKLRTSIDEKRWHDTATEIGVILGEISRLRKAINELSDDEAVPTNSQATATAIVADEETTNAIAAAREYVMLRVDSLRDWVDELRYPGLTGSYVMQMRDIDGRTPRGSRTAAYMAAEREALSAIETGDVSGLHNAVWAMHRESWAMESGR